MKNFESNKVSKEINEQKLLNETKIGDLSDVVFAFIKDSPKGVSISELQEKTGLSENQIWAVVFIAEKMGRIRMVRQGVYVDT
jgi:predicted transcriptional regulator of viral defense system